MKSSADGDCSDSTAVGAAPPAWAFYYLWGWQYKPLSGLFLTATAEGNRAWCDNNSWPKRSQEREISPRFDFISVESELQPPSAPAGRRELIRDFFFHFNCHEVILQEVTTIFCPCTGNRSAASGPGSVAPERTDQSSGLLQYTCCIVSIAWCCHL